LLTHQRDFFAANFREEDSMQIKEVIGPMIRSAMTLTVLVAGLVQAQTFPPPVISLQSNGDYTVSYSQCPYCFTDGLEAWLPDSNGWAYAGSGGISVNDPAPGVHRYRGVYLLMTWPGVYQTVYGPEASVFFDQNMQVQPVTRPSLAVQIAAEYSVSSGDIDANGTEDLYIRRSSPPGADDGTIGDVLLKRNNQGSFVASLPNQQERAISAQWQPAPFKVGKRDVNIDGYVDLILRGGGNSGLAPVSNQILFAPGADALDQPPVARTVDSRLGRFSADVDRHLIDPNYYLNHVPTRYALFVYYALNCNRSGYGYGYEYGGVFEMPDPWACYHEPQYLYVVYRDYSIFDSDAMEIASIDYGMIHDTGPTASGLQRIAEKIGAILGVAIGGWDIDELLGHDGVVIDEQEELAMGLFAALAAISEAVAQTTGEEAQNPAAERVELRGRRVLGQGPFHTALQFGQSTVSAYDSDPRPLWDGDLFSQVNWRRDHPSLTLRMGFVDGPLAPSLYWDSLLVMDRRYGDDLPYDLFPSLGQGGYNSNSYVSGIIKATLGTPTIQIESFVGGERPVPVSAFN
jgi:hypothetical protein